MVEGIRLKVCGLTTLVDAECADACGADYLGFILHPASPRRVTLEQFRAMAPRLPDRRKVAVAVEPAAVDLATMSAAGFDCFQVHFRVETPLATVASWAETVGVERLWLAPKLPPEREVAPEWLPFARHFLLDTFQAAGFGGSGKTGDWAKFAKHRLTHPDKRWILAGGLNPENIGEALRQSGATWVDVNSGVEAAPGVKDREKLKRLVARMREAAVK